MPCPGNISDIATILYSHAIFLGNTIAIPAFLYNCLIRVKLFLITMARDTGDTLLYNMANFTTVRHGSYVIIPQGVLETLQFVALVYREKP